MSRCVWDLIGNYTLNMHYNFCSLMLCKAVNIFFMCYHYCVKQKGARRILFSQSV